MNKILFSTLLRKPVQVFGNDKRCYVGLLTIVDEMITGILNREFIFSYICISNSLHLSRHFMQRVSKFHDRIFPIKELKNTPQVKRFQNVSRHDPLRKASSKSMPNSGKNLSNINGIALGFSGISLGIMGRTILAQRRNNVECEGNRLAGVIQSTLQQDSKFDWRRFWFYLKPYILEFLGAVAVSFFTLFKFFNF